MTHSLARRSLGLGAPSYGELLRDVAAQLGDRLEARRLLQAAAGLSSAALVTSLEEAVPSPVVSTAQSLAARRLAGEPLQHVLGHWGFRTLEVNVDGRALVPRPETELLVELALAGGPALDPASPRALDLGTGSGVIALSLALEHPRLHAVGVDVSAPALELAAENREMLDDRVARRVRFLQGSWYEPLSPTDRGAFDLVVANPPYLAAGEWASLDPVVRDYDPYEALVAGPTGLEAIVSVVEGAAEFLRPAGRLLVEIAPHQAEAALRLARRAGFDAAEVTCDLAGRPRVLVAGHRGPEAAGAPVDARS